MGRNVVNTELAQPDRDGIRGLFGILEGATDYARASAGWMSHAACQGEDPELFFPVAAQGPALHEIDAAKAVCGQCAVRLLCLSYALQTRQAGIWGGTTWEERSATRERSSRRAFEPA
jgi:WhiB family redox-sensing transcriptional regulator